MPPCVARVEQGIMKRVALVAHALGFQPLDLVVRLVDNRLSSLCRRLDSTCPLPAELLLRMFEFSPKISQF